MEITLESALDAPPANATPSELAVLAVEIWKRIMAEDVVRAETFLSLLPEPVRKTQLVKRASEYTRSRQKKNGSLDVIIWTGPAWEKWNALSLDKGIGGSETAAISVAREMARLGHRVTVMCQCDGIEGTFENVCYVDYRKFMSIERVNLPSCDVFISSRQPWALLLGFKSKHNVLWVHDVHVGNADQNFRDAVAVADEILVLTRWHRQFFLSTYPFLEGDNKVLVTRNGIDEKRFEGDAEPKKTGNQLIYASSPDRGLHQLLDLMPRIRERVSDAELHVYYGFETWKEMAISRGDVQATLQIRQFEERLIGKESDGIYFHGRVGQRDLAEAYMRAKVWAYPTWFSETSCISAMEAQAAGCVPVTSDYAGLSETVKLGIRIGMPSDSDEYRKTFVDSVTRLLLDDDARRQTATLARESALREFPWSGVARDWSDRFRRKIEDARPVDQDQK